jgi:hypothetical protein
MMAIPPDFLPISLTCIYLLFPVIGKGGWFPGNLNEVLPSSDDFPSSDELMGQGLEITCADSVPVPVIEQLKRCGLSTHGMTGSHTMRFVSSNKFPSSDESMGLGFRIRAKAYLLNSPDLCLSKNSVN